MPFADVNGIRLYYEEDGQGESLLLMAPTGWPGSVWDLEQVPFFARHFRVITYDQRGVGRSDQPDHEYTTELLGDDATGLLEAIGATPAHVLGFSMGGRVAQQIALKRPDILRSLVLAGTDAGREGGGAGVPFDIALSLGEHGYVGYWRDHLSHDFPFSDVFRKEHPEKVAALGEAIVARQPPLRLYLRHILARGGHDLRDQVREIRVPTLVVVGENDRGSRGGGDHVEAARGLAEAIPGAEFATIAGARHLFPWEVPEETNRRLLEFFQRHQARGAAAGARQEGGAA